MPQMSPMNWLFLLFYFLMVYYIFSMLIYYFMKFNLKNKKILMKLNKFLIKW